MFITASGNKWMGTKMINLASISISECDKPTSIKCHYMAMDNHLNGSNHNFPAHLLIDIFKEKSYMNKN